MDKKDMDDIIKHLKASWDAESESRKRAMLFGPWIMNPNDEARWKAESKPKPDLEGPVGNLSGIKIHSHPSVPEGTVYFVDEQRLEASWKAHAPLFEPVTRMLDDLVWRTYRLGLQYDLPPKPYRWQRGAFESFKNWEQRLVENNLLDDPEIRWEYQKAVFKQIGLKVKRLVWR